MMNTDNSLIFDFETLSQDAQTCAVISCAVLAFDSRVFSQESPYTYGDLLSKSKYLKFDVKSQVANHGRTIDKSTVEWWRAKPADIRAMIAPLPDDLPVDALLDYFDTIDFARIQRVWCRGNTFDPIILDSLYHHFDRKFPYDWWKIRDTRSFIEGLSVGTPTRNDFVPPEPEDAKRLLTAHNPVDDIILDVFRMQYLTRLVLV